MAKRKIFQILSGLIFLMYFQLGQLIAQDWPGDDSVQEDENTSGQHPDSEISSEMPTRGLSLKDSVVHNSRNKAGVSLGLFGLYDNIDLGPNNPSNDESLDMMILPTAFVNLGKRKTQFHADYSLEQRLFNASSNSTFHTGNLSFAYTPTRHWDINITDEVRDAPSDLLSLTGGFSPGPIGNPIGPGISGYSYKRVFMNSGSGNVSYKIDRKNRLSAYGGSQIFRYESNEASNTKEYSVGAGFNRTISRSVDASIDFMYSNYDSVSGLLNEKIKRLSGGLGYQINRLWKVYGNAGVEWIETPLDSHTPTYFSAAAARTTDSKTFTISYTKSAQYQLGTPLLTSTDTVSLVLDQRLTQKFSFLLGAYYYRSEPYTVNGLQNTFISGGGFKYLLHPNIMASVNGNYQYQDNAFRILDSPSLNRYYIYAGIEIIFPGVSRR